MALEYGDRILDTTETSGTSDYVLLGGTAGYQGFANAISNGATVHYVVDDGSGGNWEVGLGTFTAPNLLARTTILKSSNSDNKVSWTNATKSVYNALPAEVMTVLYSDTTQNKAYLSPDGSTGIPTFRALVNADLPIVNIAHGGTNANSATSGFDNLSPTTTKGDIIVNDGTNNVRLGIGIDGQVLVANASAADGVEWGSVSGTGTVVSVGLDMPSEFTVANTPVTSAGNLTVSWASETANYILAAPNGSNGTPTFRSMVAADVPTLNQNTTGTANNVTGIVTVAHGGTGSNVAATGFDNLSPITARGELIVGNATGFATVLAAGLTGQALVANTSANLGVIWKDVGSVTSVGLTVSDVSIFTVSGSPITGSGNLNIALDSQAANYVMAGPNGFAGIPGFRALVVDDLPALIEQLPLTAKGDLLIMSNVANVLTDTRLPVGSDGQMLAANSSANAGVSWTTPLSSVGLTLPSEFDVGNAVTTSGNLSATWASEIANYIFAAPDGSNGTPAFRAMTASDVPTLNQDTTGVANNVTGIVTIAHGGTNANVKTDAFDNLSPTTTKGDIIVNDGTNNVRFGVGTDLQLLTANSSSSTGFSWSDPATVTSVGLILPAELTVTGSPVTTSGNLTAAWADETSNYFFAAPDGANGTPIFRSIAVNDVPILNQDTTGNANYATYSANATYADIAGAIDFIVDIASGSGSEFAVKYNSGTFFQVGNWATSNPWVNIAANSDALLRVQNRMHQKLENYGIIIQ